MYEIREDPVDSARPVDPCPAPQACIQNHRVELRQRCSEAARETAYRDKFAQVDIFGGEGHAVGLLLVWGCAQVLLEPVQCVAALSGASGRENDRQGLALRSRWRGQEVVGDTAAD